MKVLVFCVALLGAAAASAQVPSWSSGTGRVSLFGGWRYTPNDYFIQKAGEKGLVAHPSAGGPQATGSFAYAATDSLEVAIDLFAGYDHLKIDGQSDDLSQVTYGALVALRMYWPFGPITPTFGLGIGPSLVYVSGAGLAASERVTTNYVATAGVMYRLGETTAVSLDVRYLLARGVVPDVASINAGGLWAGIGFTWIFPPDIQRDSAIR